MSVPHALQRGDMVAVHWEGGTVVAEVLWEYSGLYYDGKRTDRPASPPLPSPRLF